MPKAETIAPDGSWKVEVEAWGTSLIVYTAIGVTTRVFTRAPQNWWQRLWKLPAGWDADAADAVTASGAMASSKFPGASAALPGSPTTRRQSHDADCRAWTVGGSLGVTTIGPDGPRPTGGGAGSLNPIADMVRNGSGSATRGGVTLSAGPVNYP